MLRIDRQDEQRINDWFFENDSFEDMPPAASSRKGLVFEIEWLPLLLSFLNGVVLVNTYGGGLLGLLEKAKKILDWLRGKAEPTELSVGERILGLLLQKSRQGSTAATAELAALTGGNTSAVSDALVRLKAAGLVDEPNPGSWILIDS